jgi:twitching motility protein PilT
VISQQLLPTIDKPGRVAALEILVNTSAVANLIRQGKIDQLETSMQSGAAVGMQTMDNALKALVRKKRISGLEAYLQANNKSMFQDYKEEAELGNA